MICCFTTGKLVHIVYWGTSVVWTLKLRSQSTIKKKKKNKRKASHETQLQGTLFPFSCLSNKEWRWCAEKIWFRFRIHLSQVPLTPPEKLVVTDRPLRQCQTIERHEWTIWFHCADFGTERTKKYTGCCCKTMLLPQRHVVSLDRVFTKEYKTFTLIHDLVKHGLVEIFYLVPPERLMLQGRSWLRS